VSPCFDIKNLIKTNNFFVYILGVIGSIYLKIGLFISNEAGDKKLEPTKVTFQRFQDIDNLTSYPAPNKLYVSTFKNRTGCY